MYPRQLPSNAVQMLLSPMPKDKLMSAVMITIYMMMVCEK